MHTNKSGYNALFLIGITVATLIAIILFAFLFFVIWPMSAVEEVKNSAVTLDGEKVDPLIAKVATIETEYYNQAMAMINGT